MPARLILNADDFGLTSGINRAVEELHQAGVLSSATLMATGLAFEDAAAIARRNPTLGVGCHLVFVDGLPISHPETIPTLLCADGKSFRRSLTDFMQAVVRGVVRPGDLAREAQAQIQALQRAGIDVTHIDSHKHTHLLPQVVRPLLDVARRCGVSAVRYPFEPQWARRLSAPHMSLARRTAQSVLARCEPRFRAALELDADERTTRGTLGIAATGSLTAPVLRELLAAMIAEAEHQKEDVLYELCCHPGYHDHALDLERTRLRESREVERAALLEVMPEIFRAEEAPRLIHYGNLGIPGQQRAAQHFAPFNGYEKVL